MYFQSVDLEQPSAAAALPIDSKVSTTCPDFAKVLVTSHFLSYRDIIAESLGFPELGYSLLAAGRRLVWRICHLVLKRLVS